MLQKCAIASLKRQPFKMCVEVLVNRVFVKPNAALQGKDLFRLPSLCNSHMTLGQQKGLIVATLLQGSDL